MPLYDMKCTNKKCEEVFEEAILLTEEDKTAKCPKCGKKAEIIITNPGHYRHISWSTWKVGLGQ